MRHVAYAFGSFCLVLGLAVPLRAKQGSEKASPTFVADVAPIIKSNCLSCHTGSNARAGLDLSAPTIVKAKISLILQRVRGEGGKAIMPLGFKPLTPANIKMLEEWAKYGAPLGGVAKKHWAYVSPTRPIVPKNGTWGNGAIDAFVYEKLRTNGLKPSPEAPKEVLLRRLYLDLIGLPPTVEELDAFLSDKRTDAYERVVDTLLKSPHYGERQARQWLDLARYADTNGYEKDQIRSAYPYRDWVINAFNQNMPFDQFTLEQLAGDMLPNASMEQKIATGFHRNAMLNEEGGVDPAESQYNLVIDRVSTTSTVWLGSTLGCARCHDHKFDPFSQKDFFKSYAVFSNTDYTKQGDYKRTNSEQWREPILRVLTAEARSKQAIADKRIAESKAAVAKRAVELSGEFEKFKFALSQPVSDLKQIAVRTAKARGASLTIQPDGLIVASGPNPDQDAYSIEIDVPEGGLTALTLRAEPVAGTGPGRSGGGNFVLTNFVVSSNGRSVPASIARASFAQAGYSARSVLQGNKSSGWAIYPQTGKAQEFTVQFSEPLSKGQAKVDLFFLSPYAGHNLASFRLLGSADEFPLIRYAPTQARTDQAAASQEFHATHPMLAALQDAVEAAEASRSEIEQTLPTALVLREKPTSQPLTAPVHHRGEFLSPGELVSAAAPSALVAKDDVVASDRLSYAKWLVSKKNPLTARVQVNRMWQQYFGRGIVETDDDFGTQGTTPSHPELLDWLATEFISLKWDMKAMHRLIVTSATYRQTSVATPSLLQKDPLNFLLARGSRYRMEAEMVRDSALSASGLLTRKIGGPSVMPYQPEGVWSSPYNGERWMEDRADGRYRRGLYVFVKRTAPYASFAVFDATSREVCTSRRSRTNTPLQALTLLNDKAYLETASALGRKMSSKGIVYGFRAATGRKPRNDELEILNRALAEFRLKYARQPELVKSLGGNVEQAAWTMVGNVILNLDEAITRE